MGMNKPQVLCIYRDPTFAEKLKFLEGPQRELLIEYWKLDDKLKEKLQDSPFRFDLVFLERQEKDSIESLGITKEISDYYRDIEIIYISAKDNKFIAHFKGRLPGWQIDQAMPCVEIYQLIVFLCQQVQYRREQQMLEKLHLLSLAINSTRELKDILSHTCKTAVDILGVDHSGFVLFEKDLSRGSLTAQYPELIVGEPIIIPVRGIEIEEKLVFNKENIVIFDLEEDESLEKEVKSILLNWKIRSILIIPVVLNGKVIASFGLDMIRKCRYFYDDEIDFCKKLAAHVALAIGNNRNLEEIAVINEIGLAIEAQMVEATDIKKIVGGIREKAAQLVDVNNFFMLRHNENEDRYEFLFHEDEKDDPKKVTQEALRSSLSAYVFRQRKPVLVRKRDIESLYQKGEAILVGYPTKIWLGVPLIARQRVIGVMVVQNYYNENAYNMHDLKILTTIASQAAIAIDNYYLLQDLRKQLAQIKALYETSQEMVAESPDITNLLKKIVNAALELCNADAGLLIFYDSTREVSKVMFTHNMEIVKGMEFGPGEGMIYRVLQTGKGLFTNDYFQEGYAAGQLDDPKFRDRIQGMVQVPLKWRGIIIGVLAMSSKPGDQRIFSQEDVNQLEYFAGPAAIAIGIARTISFQQTLLHNSTEAIIAVDNKGRITEFNHSSERIIGYSRQEVLGKFVGDFYYDGINEAKRMKKILDESDRKGESVYDITSSLKGCNGERIPILFSGSILKDEFGQCVGSIGLVRDLREIIKIDEEYRKQQSLLAELESLPLDSSIKQREGLKEHLTHLMQRTCEFCRVRYIILFAGLTENDMVLSPIAWWGLPKEIVSELPHFNWRKSGLMPGDGGDEAAVHQEAEIISGWLPHKGWRDLIHDGIKGHNKEYFKDIACGVPVRLADNYRSILVFGPFTDQPDLIKMEKFLKNIALIINVRAMSWLQAIYLGNRSKESENAARLIVHRAKMYLQQITGMFGLIKRKLKQDTPAFDMAEKGEKLSVHTAEVIKGGLTSQIAEMEKEDFCFQPYSLSALVQNCAALFEERALEKNKKIVLDETIDYLPHAEVDANFLSTALGNLIDNAIKYSYTDTYIKISSFQDLENVTIMIYNVGEKMDERAKENLLKPGKRWGMSARARRIPGTGFGLWDASVIAAAHGGHADFSSTFHRVMYGRSAFLVKTWITIPIKQENINVL
jgi:PAS domain S-box-containing protein